MFTSAGLVTPHYSLRMERESFFDFMFDFFLLLFFQFVYDQHQKSYQIILCNNQNLKKASVISEYMARN